MTSFRGLAGVATLLGVLLAVGPAGAEVPSATSYQGVLLRADGSPFSGSTNIEVSIWDAPASGDPLYRETHSDVGVVDGVFQIEIGRGTPTLGTFDPKLFGEARWLEIRAAGEQLTPRQQFVSVAYALRAAVAEQLALQCSAGDLVGFEEVDGELQLACRPGCTDGDLGACYTGPPDTLGVGPCTPGLRTCSSGKFGPCTGEVTPRTESCNDIDDDCDGQVDDGDVCASSCDPFNSAAVCGPGQHCLPVAAPGSGICSGPAGAGTQGSACTTLSQCAPGFACLGVAPLDFRCLRLCNVASPACPATLQCYAMGTGTWYGFCF